VAALSPSKIDSLHQNRSSRRGMSSCIITVDNPRYDAFVVVAPSNLIDIVVGAGHGRTVITHARRNTGTLALLLADYWGIGVSTGI
jgi:hypothetical protein